MTAPDDALARALAALCLEGRGMYRRPRLAFLGDLRAILPGDHPALALGDDALEDACYAVREHLAEAYGVLFGSMKNGRGTCRRLGVRLIRR
ncbi:hypothetical protein AB0N38_04260 [Micromonospora aurantiaca]|uniref:hypothetical protein n=1 Tax=Micromonospora aurantiaca (nom. illeg.) TaxID=47850 RepID=UPI0034396C47